ncbi:MAG: Tol-Pal system beta propeller repeat protein TolB [Proteobacteria bacterium]|nr:Tol-Pal system beta propeller repeat protein TolB [Pseudomonadota bacterium]
MKPLLSFRPGLLALILGLLMLAAAPARAQLEVDVTTGTSNPLPIAVTSFIGSGSDSTVGTNIAEVIAADLERSGLFKPINQNAFIQRAEDIGLFPRFGDWRTINAQALVTGLVEREADGRLKVSFRLWDTFAEQQLDGFVYRGDDQIWRRIAHKIADAVYTRLTGESGYFDTRIVYIAESGSMTERVKQLAIMDQDGANHRFLTDGSHLVLTPRFSPTSQEITYMSFFGNTPRVYILDIDSGRREVLGDFPGMTFAPRFSPDGRRVIMSMAINGNSDIYSMDLPTRQIQRLTSDAAIDTSPAYSPDGQYVTFNSDRGGTPQLYVMRSDGSDQQRISFGEGRYSTPVWSPRGDLIAFTKSHKGTFFIGVMKSDGSGERLIAEGWLAEGPTWAPNGRVLMFFRETPVGSQSSVQLFSIDLTGRNERRVTTPLDGSDPAWSPLIP